MVWTSQERTRITVEKCMNYKVEGARPRSRPEKTWSEVTEKNYQTRQLRKDDAMDYRKWRQLIKDIV